jgi:transcriptional regulator with XRE-family HTH domain
MSKAKPTAVLRREFGLWLQKRRKSGGMSQKFVAGKAHLTITQLSRIENGHSGTRRDTIILLASIIGIDEIETLGKYAPESFQRFPEELENIPFSEFNKQELQEIVDFINFKLSQKHAAQQGETDKIVDKPPEFSGEVQPYRVKAGQLTSDTEKEKNGHTNQKPRE